jgi:hypothetical protein
MIITRNGSYCQKQWTGLFQHGQTIDNPATINGNYTAAEREMAICPTMMYVVLQKIKISFIWVGTAKGHWRYSMSAAGIYQSGAKRATHCTAG